MTQVRVSGVDLEYLEAGSGIPVVFSHGSASDLRYWEPQRDAFSEKYRFVAYSRRFHGRGTWPTEGDHSAAAHASDLIELIRQLRAGPAHVVGFSSPVALHAVIRAPALFRSLTIVEPNVPMLLEGDAEGEAIRAWWAGENARVREEAGDDDARRAGLWFELVNNRGAGAFAAQPDGLRRMWLDNFATPRPAFAVEALGCAQVAGITTPTLAVTGKHGMPYSRAIVERLARCIPGSHRLDIPGVTHFMSYQHPDRFNDAVLEFIEKH